MMISQGIELLFIAMTMSGIVCILLAAVYDLQAVTGRKRVQTIIRQLVKRRRPHVSILIQRVTSAVELERCMMSIHHTQYYSFDIVATADRRISSDDQRRIRRLARTDPRMRFYVPRKAATDSQLLHAAYRRSKRGVVVLVIEAGQVIEQGGIARAVAQMELHDAVDGIRFARPIADITSLSSLIETFASLSQQLFAKALTAAGAYRGEGGAPGLYRRHVLTHPARAVGKVNMRYDSESVMSGNRARPFGRGHGEVLIAILLVGLMTYSAVVAATLQSAVPLLLGWSIIGTWLFASIWFNDASKFTRKLGISACVPIGYFAIASALLVTGAEAVVRRMMRI